MGYYFASLPKMILEFGQGSHVLPPEVKTAELFHIHDAVILVALRWETMKS